MKFLKILLISLLFFFLPVLSFAKEKPQVIFINQVRGEECCSKGNLDNLEKQVNAFIQYQIPAFFVIRYDALANPEYVDYLKQKTANSPLIKLGLMIEITPNLAAHSGVKYKDTEERWFEAQNSFTVGYQKDDRKKIIDRLFSTFKKTFGYYPSITSSWLIDTETLNYIHDRYKVLAQQITREQWGQDSYTLYGGPPHYPYPASRNWAFIPDFKEKNPALILRQTVTDPLYNYGETKKAFTSQPNDYIGSGLDFNYFQKLINQALFKQKNSGFALLGLENSMEENYQNEYLKQIEYVSQLKSQVVFPDLKQLLTYWIKQQTTFYSGKDLINNSDNQAEFVTTPEFRKRVRTSGGKVFTTDYRYFDSGFSDPYTDYVAKKYGYWIVPYAIDYSHTYHVNSIFPETRNDFIIDKQPTFKIGKTDPKKFNEKRFANYPLYLPEPFEREINRFKSLTDIKIDRTINIDFFAKDQFGYPVNISSPLSIRTDPRIDNIKYQPDSSKHSYIIPNDKLDSLTIDIISDKKIVKQIYLFPRFLPLFKISL
ncbi:hypothetical protein HZA76_01030 [Candidatus Roizmanbacteria bacterium]|nr:hypothetical protein [Candidatus Roizmanbacteria bacterium]